MLFLRDILVDIDGVDLDVVFSKELGETDSILDCSRQIFDFNRFGAFDENVELGAIYPNVR
jgi:hypothetical protein